MLATTIVTPSIPSSWHPIVEQIRTAFDPPPIWPATASKGVHYRVGNASSISIRRAEPLKVEQLGWSALETLETHLHFRNFSEDWDAPGMEVYDSPLIQHDPVAETFQPRTELGKKLLAIRRAYVENGGPLLDADTFDRELQHRRGGVS